jgi:transcriptional regulator with XRE-family HTH domain
MVAAVLECEYPAFQAGGRPGKLAGKWRGAARPPIGMCDEMSIRGAIPRGDLVVRLRKLAGLTQEILAAECDCDVKTIRSAEHSKRLDVATLRRIAVRLGVECRDLVDDESRNGSNAHIAAVERWIAAFNARDAEAVARCFGEDGVINVLADPALPGAGEFRGVARITTWARICFATYLAELITPSMYQLDAVGDFVFVRVERPQLKCLLNGNQSPVSVMWEFLVTGDNISRMRIYPESGAIERMVFTDVARSAL